MRSIVTALCATVLVTACTAGDRQAGSGGTTSPSSATTSPPSGTATPTSRTATSPSGSATPTSTTAPADEEPAAPVELTQRCRSPLGFAVSYPASWAVNSGQTVPACTRFAPDPFTVPPATDARVGAVTASIEAAPFDRVADPAGAREASRTETTVDGRRALRIERVSTGQGLYQEGVRSTGYVVELADGQAGPRTLVVNTVGLPRFDYARNVDVLDRMIGTLDVLGP